MFVIAIGLKNMVNVGVWQGMPLFVTGLLYMAITITTTGLILLFLGLVRTQIDIRNMLMDMLKKIRELKKVILNSKYGWLGKWFCKRIKATGINYSTNQLFNTHLPICRFTSYLIFFYCAGESSVWPAAYLICYKTILVRA